MREDPLGALLDPDRRRLVRAAARLLGPADAEDVVQDACVRALEAETHALEAAPAWLLTVVRNLAIDRLRRRRWMQYGWDEADASDAIPASPSAESDAALAEEAAIALRLLAARLTPAEAAVVLLHEVFGVGHAEIAQAGGQSEAACRQQLRRALTRLRQAERAPARRPWRSDRESSHDALFGLCLQALRLRDPQALWALLRQPPISASTLRPTGAGEAASTPRATACSVVHAGGQLGLLLTLDGVALCVVPLGVRSAREQEAALP